MPRADPLGVVGLDRLAKHRMCRWKNRCDELHKPQTSESKKRLWLVAAPARSSPRCSRYPLLDPELRPAASIRMRPGRGHSPRLERLLHVSAPERDRSALSHHGSERPPSPDRIPPYPCARVSRCPREYPGKSVPMCEVPFFPRACPLPLSLQGRGSKVRVII